jgi:predicted DNA-binding protein with PD1-like motif
MKSKLLHEHSGLKTFALVFDKDELVRDALLQFGNEKKLAGAHLNGIGALSEVTLGYFDREQKDYRKIQINQQVEVLSFSGNIIQKDDQSKLHAHIVVGKADGTAHGGHFLGGRVWPTLELIVTELPAHLRRTQDKETGLALLDLAA